MQILKATYKDGKVEFDEKPPLGEGKVFIHFIEDEKDNDNLDRPFKSRGIFNKYANVDLIQGEEGVWEREVVEEYRKGK